MEIRNLTRRRPCLVGGRAGMTDDDKGQFIYRKAAIRCVKELEDEIVRLHKTQRQVMNVNVTSARVGGGGEHDD